MNKQPPFFDPDRTELAQPRQEIQPPAPADDEIDLGQLLGTLWSGKLLITFITLLGLAAGGFIYAVTPPVFQADALLQLEERTGRLALPAGMRDLIENDPRTATEMELLRSRMILGQAVADANLDWQARPLEAPVIGSALRRFELPVPEIDQLRPYARPGQRIDVEFLQVPPAWLNVEIPLTVTAEGFTVTLPDGTVLGGRVGQTVANASNTFALRLADLRADPGRQYVIRHLSTDAAIERLRSGLTVGERGRGSSMLELRYRSSSPEEAVQALNAVAQAYVRQNVTRSAAEAQSSLDFIEQQIPDAERAVTDAAQRLNVFRREQSVLDLSFDTQNLLQQISRTESELREIDEREAEISQRLTPNHPTYRQLLNERAQLEARLETRLADLRSQASDLPETQRELVNLTRELDMAQTIYNQLVTRAQEIRVVRASTIGNVRVVDNAVLQGRVAPVMSRTMALALVLGLLAGIALVLVRSWMRKGVQGVEELERAGIPVFATINYTPYAAPRRLRKGARLPIVALTHPDELAVEAFRSLRTSLHFGMLDASSRSITVTSSAPDAGKSFTSVNLAVVAAQAGQQVVLVDSDLRRGQLRKYFGISGSRPGLADYLAGTAELEEVLAETEVPGLWFLPAGRYPPNPSELLMRRELTNLVEVLGPTFDLSVFDTPPVMAVTDAAIVGRATGATISVVRHDETSIAEVLATQKALRQAGVRLAGCVLNGFDPRKSSYGAGYSYSYRYTYKSRAS